MDSKVARRLRENALVKSLNGNTIAKEPETSKVTRSLAMILEYSKDCSSCNIPAPDAKTYRRLI